MTDEDEFAARSQLKWTREGDAWILLYRRRENGVLGCLRVCPETSSWIAKLSQHETEWTRALGKRAPCG
jgi:hypothetical protein